LTGLGQGTGDAGVREALWGKPDAFDQTSKHYQTLKKLLDLRAKEPALRYGRQYFRQVSGDNNSFSLSPFPDGVLTFSRILNDREIIIAVNPNTTAEVSINVLVDGNLNAEGEPYRLLYSNLDDPTEPGSVTVRQGNKVEVTELDGKISRGGPVKSVPVRLGPMEIQVISL
jgi:hypothetical protein